jgi:hypothetical protein
MLLHGFMIPRPALGIFHKAAPMFSANRLRSGRLITLFGLIVLLAVSGCSTQKLVEVSGQATVDGKPLTKGVIVFAPDKDNTLKTLPKGEVDEHGKYRLSTAEKEGVPLGWYKVYVAYSVKSMKGEPIPVHEKYLDAEHTPLSVEVVANPQPGAYDLKFSEK